MVEMLGVLAIVGVLSVGAIAGYSKAMTKYRLNKYSEQMNTVINAMARNVHSFDNINGNTGSPTVLTQTFIKMGEIPVEMIKPADNDSIYDIFGQHWQIFIGSDGNNFFLTSWHNDSSSFLSSKSADSLAVCQTLLTVAKENSDNIYMINANSTKQESNLGNYDDNTRHLIYGNNYCNNAGKKCLQNLTLDDIYSICTEQVKNGKAVFQFVWRRH